MRILEELSSTRSMTDKIKPGDKVLTAQIAEKILSERHRPEASNRPFLVGIDGIDCAGKTTLADELASVLKHRSVNTLRASIDGFHQSSDLRYARGEFCPEGYYHDSFDYELVKDVLLNPLKNWTASTEVRTSSFDFKTDSATDKESSLATATEDTVLVFDGVFLFRKELVNCWDLKIFVDITFDTSLKRALKRDLELLGKEEVIVEKYQRRYFPGQRLYLDTCKPMELADLIVENNGAIRILS